MDVRNDTSWRFILRMAWLVAAVVGLAAPVAGRIEPGGPSGEVTFTKDIAPILQRSCQNCHRPNWVAPMSLMTYEEVRPWARAIKTRTALRDKRGAMPPWFIEKNLGIQQFVDDPSLSEEEIAKIAKWADSGAPRGNPADMPPPLDFSGADGWHIGKPDLILSSPEILVKAVAPDWWGDVGSVPVTGLTEDRYVAAVEAREVNDVKAGDYGATAVGGRFVVHHLTYKSDGKEPGTSQSWAIHEVGRQGDIYDPRAGRLLVAGSNLHFSDAHLHSNGRNDVRARIEVAFKFHPKGYKPTLRTTNAGASNGVDVDVKPMTANQQLHAYVTLQEHTKILTFEPHMHAPGMRMCIESIWGDDVQTLNCAGYDHNWVRSYIYADDAAPLLPKGTILHIIGFMDTSPANRNVADPRNWQGGGRRSVSNMFRNLNQAVALTDEEFEREMAERRKKLNLTRNDVVIGCPLCQVDFSTPTGVAVTTASR